MTLRDTFIYNLKKPMSLPEIPYDKWFHDKPHPHDVMPIATDNPRPEEEIADAYASRLSLIHI